jgi:1-acyl-sn-glycerol-3-phosphate acyltransferase
VGHAELAIRHGVPIVPIAVVGAEEQHPSLFSSKRLGKLFGIGSVPIPISPLPLPVRYRIYYGEPIHVQQEFSSDVADEPQIVSMLAKRVENSVASLIEKGLDEREGIFK